MRFRVRHTTVYRYERPVILGPHVFRMHPRPDGLSEAASFDLAVYPHPAGQTADVDAEGNLIHAAWFEGEAVELRVSVSASGETRPAAPLDPGFPLVALPPEYGEEAGRLQSYLNPGPPEGDVPVLARSAAQDAGGSTLVFLDMLSRMIFTRVANVSRLTGAPLDPETTLRDGRGSCRDLAVLFIACCRHQGVAARFVSGYLPAPAGERQHMHAWAEALIPGAGWRAYDPTQGGLAGESHIPVAAAAESDDAAPIAGSFTGFGRSEMTVELLVETWDSAETALR
jgi:transglutaminase-like putative cysteine protease